MPGRGQPWKKGGHVDETIDTGDIVDGTIKLEDLATEVTDAIAGAGDGVGYDEVLDEGNSLPKRVRLDFKGAGVVATDGIEDTTTVTIAGGGGGSNNLESATVWEEDFYTASGSYTNIDKYNLLDGDIQGGGAFPIKVGGVADMSHSNNLAGDQYGLEAGGVNNDFVDFDFTSKNLTLKVGIGFQALTNMSAFVGFMDDFLVQSVTTLVALEADWTEAVYFRWHTSESANWFAVTMSGGTKTETDTGVAVTSQNIIKLKIVHTQGTNAVFSINGNTVATHTTNLPSTDLGLQIGGATLTAPNTNGAQATPHGLDYIQVEQDR